MYAGPCPGYFPSQPLDSRDSIVGLQRPPFPPDMTETCKYPRVQRNARHIELEDGQARRGGRVADEAR